MIKVPSIPLKSEHGHHHHHHDEGEGEGEGKGEGKGEGARARARTSLAAGPSGLEHEIEQANSSRMREASSPWALVRVR